MSSHQGKKLDLGGRELPWRWMAVVVAVALAVATTLAFAAIPDRNGRITGCVKPNGALRIIDAAKTKCRARERRLRWNVRGPRGATGPIGPRGAIGPAGPAGPAGSAGRDAGTIVDGGTCADVQAAIDALPSGGGAVIVRPGTYVCSSSIVVDRDDVSLRGSGAATVLRLADHANRPVLVLGQTAKEPTTTRSGIHVSDLAIDGNRANQDFECSQGACTGTDFLRNNGISLRRVADTRVERVTVRNAKSGGLVPELGSRRLTVRDFTTSGNEFDGIAGYQTEDSVFTGLHLHGNDGAGLSFDIDFDHNVVADSVIEGNGDVGIFMRDSTDNTFTGVHVRDSGSHGIFLAQVDGDASKPAAGNTFDGLVVSGSGANPAKGGYGMRVNDASCVDNLLTSSQFAGNREGAVSEAVPGLVEELATIHR